MSHMYFLIFYCQGPTGAGKTTCIHCLQRCFTEMGRPHSEMRMNPKAITAPQMFGRLDVSTNDWTDGIFSTLWRRTLKIKPTEFSWLVLDGPVDAVWIENLNSVLDDNKTLTLANGDRIVMAANCKIVFEPDNVDNASPATVSRMGMVYMSSSVLGWSVLVDGWLLKRKPNENRIIRSLFDRIYDDLLSFVIANLDAKMNLLEALYVRQTCDVIAGLIDYDPSKTFSDRHIEKFFLFALMWSLGCVLELEDRLKMQEFVLNYKNKLAWPRPTGALDTIFEYYVAEDGNWKHWREIVPMYQYPETSIPDFNLILVPNVDNVRTLFMIDITTKQNKPLLLIGEQGTAKTVMIKSFLGQYNINETLSKSFNFSSATPPEMFQRTIESYVEKRVATTYGPPGGRRMTIFVDDINMPTINNWGDQITNEIVRQLMEYGGFYSLDKPGDFSIIADVLIVAAMIHPGGGRNDIPPRLKRQFCIFNCTLPSEDSMDKIFSEIGQGFFCAKRFNPSVVSLVPHLVPLTRKVWQLTKIKMLATPNKFHYVFNLRDLSRIWQGLLTIRGEQCRTEYDLMMLWHHECTRVISDRFVNFEDKNWFDNTLKETAKVALEDLFEFYPQKYAYFVDFLRYPPEPTGEEPEDFVFEAPKIYEHWHSKEYILNRIFEYQDSYNEIIHGPVMDLVFFDDALKHLIIISRIIRQARGNVLLVGVGGSGKQSLTRLASFIASYVTFQIQLTRSYNINNLMDDLKFMYKVAGLQGNGLTFIFTDNEIKSESFLEYMNLILSSGEISNLFPKDEMDGIISQLTPVMFQKEPNRVPTVDNVYSWFIERSRSNLHLVLCFSPVGEKFRNRALKFPALISGCTIDWFLKWPRDALEEVSEHILHEFAVVATDEIKHGLILATAYVHDSVQSSCVSYFERFRRQTFVTPKSFLSFLSSYKDLYAYEHAQIVFLKDKMSNGLSKLVEAADGVDKLTKELAVKEQEIAAANLKSEEILQVVMAATRVATKIKEEASITKEKAEALVKKITEATAIAEASLEEARPALEAAETALRTIKASDIATVRKLGKPPYLITLIMDCVLILFKKKLLPVAFDEERNFISPSWDESLKVMADVGFLKNLQHYPKDTINDELVDLMIPYTSFSQYNFEAAKSACGNVAGLIQWTISMCSFYAVNKNVLPIKANLAKLKAKLDSAMKKLNDALALLKAKEEEVAACQREYDAAMAAKQKIQDEADACIRKMDAAKALINGLGGERIRWTDALKRFKDQTDRLIGDVLIMVGFLNYSGPFNQEYRNNLNDLWFAYLEEKELPVTSGLNVINQLTDQVTISEWNLQGLPNDDLSIQNGIIVTKGSRYPLLIDPQSQGKTWISRKEKANNLRVTQLTDKWLRQHVEDCISQGIPLLIEDIMEELDPMLDNVLDKNYVKFGNMFKVHLGDREIDVSPEFRLYITTKLPNPKYSPEVSAKTSVIDFTVTMKGLEDQLLGRVILSEKREIEEQRVNLVTDVTANKRKMKDLEENLLLKLTSVKGQLVDDVTVIEVLNITKETVAEINEKLIIAKDTEIEINAAREEFRPVAARGSVLYFLVVAMADVNVMYQTSLSQFLELFNLSLKRSTKAFKTSKRLKNIMDYLTFEIYRYQSRGLYERHKFMFLLMLTLRIDNQLGVISQQEFDFVIKGGAALDLNSCPPKTMKWITDTCWLNLVELSKIKNFQYILQQVASDEKHWKVWFEKDKPEEYPIPSNFVMLDVFRSLLVIRAWCPDRIMSQARKYIINSQGDKFGETVVINYEQMFEESRPMTPLTCLLSMGSDPTPMIELLAKRWKIVCSCMSMGQGQEIHARKLVLEALKQGGWILLQNCHLSIDYMNELLNQLVDCDKGNKYHNDFRLWITCEPHPQFPIALLQMCIKYTNEAPSGIKAGLKRTYGSIGQDFLDYSTLPMYLPLVFGVSYLHTIVQERRKFGPIGWNIPYEFNSADWLCSCMFVQNHLDDYNPLRGISWSTMRYMFGEVHYGGRVTDDYDKRLLSTFCRSWFGEFMFSQHFQYYPGYFIMSFKNVAQYLSEIDLMPNIDAPQAYGLNPNADITYNERTATNMLDQILAIQPKETASGGETREQVVTRIVKEMLTKKPPTYDMFSVRDRLKIMGLTTPMNIFLRQEIDRMQKVLKLVKSTLEDLLLGIEGTIIMNEKLQLSFNCIYDAKIPDDWLRFSWESSSLGFWYTELIERNNQYTYWCYQGRPPCFWMTGFFNAQGFLTSMRQEVARAHKGWALDAVMLHNEVTKFQSKEEARYAPNEGVLVYGLYLDGAAWDRRILKLVESTPKIVYCPLPVVHIYAIYSTAPKDPRLYVCPVYKKPKRTGLTYIDVIWLPSEFHPDHWILRGVAALCDTK